MTKMASPESIAVPQIDLFLSYDRRDRETVLHLRDKLNMRGIRSFLDLEDLVAGVPWPQALEEALRSSRAVAVFLGAHDLGTWQKRELFFALDLQVQAEREARSLPVIPVMLRDAQPQPGFLFLNTWADFRKTADEDVAFENLIRAIGSDQRRSNREVSTVCPYLDLRTFQEEDQAFFFGRTAFVEQLSQKVQGQARFLALVGPSGSGKSSLVMAGLLPVLRRQRRPQLAWDAISFAPGADPWWNLSYALTPILEPGLPEIGFSCRKRHGVGQ